MPSIAEVEERREELLGQRGAVVWFTGLSGSGKTALARAVEGALVREGRFAFVLDGDTIRQGLNRDLGFSPKDRAENIRRAGHVASLFAQAGVVALVAFISPYRADRDAARRLLAPGRFFEVHCAADLASCERRDVKGLYQRARAGLIPEFTGVSAPYEPPLSPELRLDTARASLQESAGRVLELLRREGIA